MLLRSSRGDLIQGRGLEVAFPSHPRHCSRKEVEPGLTVIPPPEGTDGGGWPDAPEMIQRSYRRCGSWKESNCRTKSWTWDFRSAPTSIVIVSLSSQPTCTEVLAHGQSSSNSVLRGMCLGMCILIHPLGDSYGLKSKNSISASVAFNPFWPYFSSRPHTHLTKVS